MESEAHIPWYFKGAHDYIDGWFLMGTPMPILAISVAYVVFVLKLGPALMDKRPAFQLRKPLLVYNILQVLYCGYVTCKGSSLLYTKGLLAKECVTDDSTTQRFIADTIYLYLLSKISELLDTVFFVLRKKKNQTTFLHVYHHCMMMLATWSALKYDPSYGIFFLGTLNSFVHVIMYTYYGLSAFPRLEKYLWWKKYLTLFQLVQFVLIVLQVAAVGIISECRPSYLLLVVVFFNVFLMIYLFSDFYKKSYIKEDGTKKSQKSDISVAYTNGKSTVKFANSASQRDLKSKGV